MRYVLAAIDIADAENNAKAEAKYNVKFVLRPELNFTGHPVYDVYADTKELLERWILACYDAGCNEVNAETIACISKV